MERYSSRLEGFYRLSPRERVEMLAEVADLSPAETGLLLAGGLTLEQSEQLIENVVGLYPFPLGIAANFTINDRDYLIPMVIEEPSVVAAASHAAKLVRECGGFTASADEPLMIGEIQLLFHGKADLHGAAERIRAFKSELLALANGPLATLVELGGGSRDLQVREFPETSAGPMLIVDVTYDVRDAMGANMVNTACESISPRLEELTGGRVNLRILTNLADKRLARASCRLTPEVLGGQETVRAIFEAQVMAEVDPYRATTHNKGVMNGIDAVALATGNDWRAIEAGAHAYAARDGRYRPITTWRIDANGDLLGSIELPMAVGIIGGLTRIHPITRIALKIMGVDTGRELAQVMASVGLAQNFAAIRALATEGIQKGHMKLHARRLEGQK